MLSTTTNLRRLVIHPILVCAAIVGLAMTSFALAQDTGLGSAGVTIRLAKGTVIITDGFVDTGSGTGVVFASGTAHCQGGTYNKVGTGNDKGKCGETQVDANGNTSEYGCDDGAGNTVTITCGRNGGKGVCESTGSGTCGEFKK